MEEHRKEAMEHQMQLKSAFPIWALSLSSHPAPGSPSAAIAITTILGGNGRGAPSFFDTLGLVLLSFPRLLIPNLILAATHPCSLFSPIFQIGTSTLEKHLGIPNR